MKSQFNESYQEYYRIIEEAQLSSRVKLNRDHQDYTYYENHHIVPDSLGGSNSWRNMVLLTPEEHYICHSLLPDFCEGKSKAKMVWAWNALNNMGAYNEGKELLGSKKYGELKRNYSKERKDFYNTDEGRNQAKQQGNSLRNFYQTEEGKENLENRLFTVKKFYQTEEGKESIQLRAIKTTGGKNHNAIPIFQLDRYTGKIIKEWDCVADADREVEGANTSEIAACARGRYTLAGNYIWIYKEDYSVENVSERLKKVQGRKTGKKDIIQIDKAGKLTEWTSISEAARSLNIDRSGISNCARGKRDNFKGSVWKFKN